jgi:hypothetical protein
LLFRPAIIARYVKTGFAVHGAHAVGMLFI